MGKEGKKPLRPISDFNGKRLEAKKIGDEIQHHGVANSSQGSVEGGVR